MALELQKIVYCFQFWADSSKKSKSVAAIYVCAFERSHYTLSENGFVYYPMIYCSGDFEAAE